jgi:uncharacterized protein (DUF433 family)
MLLIETQPIPLHIDPQGVVRVGATRVTLETVVSAYLDGDTAEEIAEQYPTLSLSDVYAVIAYYLRYRDETDRYLSEQRQQARKAREMVEERCSPTGLRQRLLNRRKTSE